ncbi:MAG: YihY/virulence factor BrkB family protein [Ignavibacteria bacterium]|nr:YihY/virulence factor BrkB family protein [Ignavibacteria bacterium]
MKSAAQTVGSTFEYYAVGIYNRTDDDHAFLLAGGLAFSLVICAVPLVLIVFSLLGIVLDRPFLAEEINNYIDRIVPYEKYAEYVRGLVSERVEEFRVYKNLAGLLGLIGLLFAASSLFSSLRTILNTVYRIGDTSSILVNKLRDFALILLVLAYFLLAAAFVPFLEIVFGFAEQIEVLAPLRIDVLADVSIKGGSFLVFLAAVIMMYYFVPNKRLPLRVIVVSALATSVLWTIAQEMFGVYVKYAVTMKRVYGTYMLLIAVVFWIYYSSLVFIVGAEVGQLYRERKEQPRSD